MFDLTDELKLKPSTMIKGSFGAPFSIDLSLNLLVKSVFELGISHRFEDSVSAMVGIQATQKLRVGYAYGLYNERLWGFECRIA